MKTKKENPRKCYVDFMDCKNNFRETRKDFTSYEAAKKWVVKTFEKFDQDTIGYY